MLKKGHTLTNTIPLDFPSKDRPFRIYAALTNACNRSCPWCSACSSPAGSTYLKLEDFQTHLPTDIPFTVQLEGGEPTLHPRFWDFVNIAMKHKNCRKIVVVTNGVLLPRTEQELCNWLTRFNDLLILKLSINHYLLEKDSGLFDLACLLQQILAKPGQSGQLVLNVRLRKNNADDQQKILKPLEQKGLIECANVFNLQRYGFANHIETWDDPYVVQENFMLLNPDGKAFQTDIIARSEAMRELP